MKVSELLGGRYRLQSRLGVGGMSVIWQADDEVLGRPVAVKMLAGTYATEEHSRRRIRAEAQVAARLSHPNIMNIFDYGEGADGVPYVVMELLSGPTLGQRLAAGPLATDAALAICAEVAAALAAAHAEGLVHRDVKPANVVLTASGAKVVDFGIAALVDQPEECDPDAPVLGTPAYLAPERLILDEILPASDVYALGLLIYRVLTNRLPWQAETTTQMLDNHVYMEPEPLPPVSGVPARVVELCHRCLAKEPADRPTAREAAAILADAAGIRPRPQDQSVQGVPLASAAAGWSGTPGQARAGSGLLRTGSGLAATGSGLPVAVSGMLQTGPTRARAEDRQRRRAAGILVAGLAAVAALLVAVAVFKPGGPAGGAGMAAARPLALDEPTSAPPTEPPPSPTASAAPTVPPVQGGVGGRRSSAPPSPTRSSAPSSPTASPAQSGTALSTQGGTIYAICVEDDKVRVLNAVPAPGYLLKKLELGIRDEAAVEFESTTGVVRVKVRCVNWAPITILA